MKFASCFKFANLKLLLKFANLKKFALCFKFANLKKNLLLKKNLPKTNVEAGDDGAVVGRPAMARWWRAQWWEAGGEHWWRGGGRPEGRGGGAVVGEA